jgi:hypothetical protein
MKKTFSILLTLALVLSFSVVAVPMGTVGASTSTINVSQPVQVTSDSHYERGQAIIYDGANYWLFYGRSVSVTATYEAATPPAPDTHDYKIYYKKASTVAGLASATPTLLNEVNNANIYLGEISAATNGGTGRIFVYGARDRDGAPGGQACDLYAFSTLNNGVSWNSYNYTSYGVSGVLPDGSAHHAAVNFGGQLWVAWHDGSGWASKYYSGGWHGPYDITTTGPGLGKFYVEGSNLYFVRATSGTQNIFQWNGSTWSQIDSATEAGAYDPTIYKIGSNYVCAYAPYISPKQWIKAKVGSSLSSLLSGGTQLAITFGGYGTTNTWVDMWPTGFTDNSGATYLFYTSERSPTDGSPTGASDEVAGNIWYLKVDWPVTNDHYTYIENAVDNASSGATIEVAAGTYAGATVDQDVTIEPKTGDVVTINDGPQHPAGFLRAGFWFQGFTGNGATIRGFQFAGTNQAGTTDDNLLDFAIFSRGANDVTVENNVITDTLQAITNWHGDRWQIRNNQITDLWTLNGGGIGILVGANDGTTVQDNTVSDNQISGTLYVYSGDGGGYDGTGIVLYTDFRWGGSGGIVTNTLVSGNDISMVSNNKGVVDFNGIELTDTNGNDANPSISNNQVVSNNIHGNSDDGIAVSAGTNNNDFNLNCIYGNLGWGVWYGGGLGPIDAEDNWWGDDSGPSVNGPGTGDAVSTNVDFDPWTGKVSSVSTTTSTGTASFASSSGGIANLKAVTPTPSGCPVALPHGVFNFTICCIPSGGTVTLTVTLPKNVPVGTRWWKYQNGTWDSLPNLSDNGDAIMVISLTDGGQGDGDLTVNGQITDDGGPGGGGAAVVGWETYPTNKARVLLPWIVLLAAIMAGAGFLVVRRRRAQG